MGHAYTSVTKYELLALSAFDYSTGETEIHMYIDFVISYCVVSYTTILQNVNEMGDLVVFENKKTFTSYITFKMSSSHYTLNLIFDLQNLFQVDNSSILAFFVKWGHVLRI